MGNWQSWNSYLYCFVSMLDRWFIWHLQAPNMEIINQIINERCKCDGFVHPCPRVYNQSLVCNLSSPRTACHRTVLRQAPGTLYAAVRNFSCFIGLRSCIQLACLKSSGWNVELELRRWAFKNPTETWPWMTLKLSLLLMLKLGTWLDAPLFMSNTITGGCNSLWTMAVFTMAKHTCFVHTHTYLHVWPCKGNGSFQDFSWENCMGKNRFRHIFAFWWGKVTEAEVHQSLLEKCSRIKTVWDSLCPEYHPNLGRRRQAGWPVLHPTQVGRQEQLNMGQGNKLQAKAWAIRSSLNWGRAGWGQRYEWPIGSIQVPPPPWVFPPAGTPCPALFHPSCLSSIQKVPCTGWTGMGPAYLRLYITFVTALDQRKAHGLVQRVFWIASSQPNPTLWSAAIGSGAVMQKAPNCHALWVQTG